MTIEQADRRIDENRQIPTAKAMSILIDHGHLPETDGEWIEFGGDMVKINPDNTVSESEILLAVGY